MNCWEMFDCQVKEKCPAYPDHGKYCARVAGTLCQGKEQVMMANKIEGCNQCNFYKSDHYDLSFKGFIRLGSTQARRDAVLEVADPVIETIEAKIDKLLEQYQCGAVGKKDLTEQIGPLLEQKKLVLESA